MGIAISSSPKVNSESSSSTPRASIGTTATVVSAQKSTVFSKNAVSTTCGFATERRASGSRCARRTPASPSRTSARSDAKRRRATSGELTPASNRPYLFGVDVTYALRLFARTCLAPPLAFFGLVSACAYVGRSWLRVSVRVSGMPARTRGLGDGLSVSRSEPPSMSECALARNGAMRCERARVMGASVRRFFCGGPGLASLGAGEPSSRSRVSSCRMGSIGDPREMLCLLGRTSGEKGRGEGDGPTALRWGVGDRDRARTGVPYTIVNLLVDGAGSGGYKGFLRRPTRSSIAYRMATSEQVGRTSICSARGSFALRMAATVRSWVRDMVMRSAWQQKGATLSAVMTIASSSGSSFWSAMHAADAAIVEAGKEASARPTLAPLR